MSPTPARVLIVLDDDPALIALHDYFTFRGCLVDGAENVDDARALVRYMSYDAVIVATSPPLIAAMPELARDLHSSHVAARLVAIADDVAKASPALSEADAVVTRAQPISQLARQVRQAIGGSARSA